jgi:signal transduction histidine kinase
LIEPGIKPGAMKYLTSISGTITHEVDRANTALDMMLASLRMDLIDSSSFTHHSMKQCVEEAVERYTFNAEERVKVSTEQMADFTFYGSDTLLTMVLFNLFKNALHAIHAAGKGEILLSSESTPTSNILRVTDTGTGVEKHILSRMFDPFFTTKKSGGSGIGLAFCQRVIASFGGRMRCVSTPGEFTTFIMDFPVLSPGGKLQAVSSGDHDEASGSTQAKG